MGLDITIKTSRHEIDFRKHNYLMPWMKDIIGSEVENCEEYEITKDQLEDLLANVESVLNDHSKASILLPTQGGFFWGSIDYDEYYFEDLEYARDKLSEMLNDMDGEENATFWSWW